MSEHQVHQFDIDFYRITECKKCQEAWPCKGKLEEDIATLTAELARAEKDDYWQAAMQAARERDDARRECARLVESLDSIRNDTEEPHTYRVADQAIQDIAATSGQPEGGSD